MAFFDEKGNFVDTASYGTNTDLTMDQQEEDSLFDFDNLNQEELSIFKEDKLSRVQELKEKHLYRKSQKLNRNEDGSLVHDSNAMIRIKELANAGIRGADWLLEASENIADFGQGDIIDENDQFKANNMGKSYNMQNKDFISAREVSTQDLIDQYHSATNDPNADKGIYTLRKFDGYNKDGSPKYIYKYGLADVSADARYRNQYIEDGYEIVEEKRFAGAEDWEKTWNASQGVLDSRVLDSDMVRDEDGNLVTRDKASGVNFGAGYTELLDKDLLGTDHGKTEEDYARNKEYSKRLTAMADARRAAGLDDSVVDAIQSGAAKTLVDTADFILDVVTPGDNTLLNEAKKQENIDKFVGYDRTESTQALAEAAGLWKQGDYLKSIGTVLTDFNTMAESVPMMLGMVVGSGKFKAAQKLLSGIEKAKKSGKSLEDIVALRDQAKKLMSKKEWATYEKYKDQSTKLKILDHVSSNLGFHTIVGAMTNNVLDERIANKIENGEPGSVGMDEVIGTYALQLPLLAIDRLSFQKITGIGEANKRAFKTAFGMLNEEGKKTVLGKISEKAAGLITAGSAEGAQEYVQTWGEILGAKVGIGEDGSISYVLNDQENQDEALMGGLGGLGAGVQMKGIADTPDNIAMAGQVGKRIFEGKTTKALRILKRSSDLRNAEFTSRDVRIKAGNMLAGVDTWETDDISKDFNTMVDAITEKFTMIPSDKVRNFAAGLIVKEAFNSLKNSENQTPEAYKAFADNLRKLHNDPNVDFSIKSLVEEDADSAVDEFMEILQADYSTREEQDAAILEGERNLNKSQQKNVEEPIAEADADMEGFSGKEFGSSIEEDELTADQRRDQAIDNFIANLTQRKEFFSEYVKEYGSNNENSGSTVVDNTFEDYDNILSIVQEYRNKGKKNVKGVAEELASIGFIQDPYTNGDGIVVTGASMRQYQRDLTKAMLNEDIDIASGLLEDDQSANPTSLESLAKFANSRLFKFEGHFDKEGKRKGDVRKYNITFIKSMEKDNDRMLELIDSLLEVANASSKIDENIKPDYIANLQKSRADVVEAQRRASIIKDQIKKQLISQGIPENNIDFDNENFLKRAKREFIKAEFSKDGKTLELYDGEYSSNKTVIDTGSGEVKTEKTPEHRSDAYYEDDMNAYQVAKDGEYQSTYELDKNGANNKPVKQPESKEYKNGDKIELFSQIVLDDDLHITYNFNPEGPQNPNGPEKLGENGKEVTVNIVGTYKDENMEYDVVEVIVDGKKHTTQADGKRPLHITRFVNKENDIKPFMTGVHAENNPDLIQPKSGTIKGKLSVGYGKYWEKKKEDKPAPEQKEKVEPARDTEEKETVNTAEVKETQDAEARTEQSGPETDTAPTEPELRQKQVDQLDAIFEQEAIVREKLNSINVTKATVKLQGLIKTLQESINKDLDEIASLKKKKEKASQKRKDVKEAYSEKENGETVWMLKKAKELFTKIWHKIRKFTQMIKQKQNDVAAKEDFKQEVQTIIDALDPLNESTQITVDQIQNLIDKVGLKSNIIEEAGEILAEQKKANKLDSEYKRTRKEFAKSENIRENIEKVLLDGVEYTIDTGSSKSVKVHDGENDPIVIEYTPEQRDELRRLTADGSINKDIISGSEILQKITDAVNGRVEPKTKPLPVTMLGNIKTRFERFGTETLPKIRTAFKINKKLGIFATMDKPFSALLNADITPSKDADKVFAKLMKEFPESIRNVILSSKEDQDSLRDQIDAISGFMNQIEVPRERVRNLHKTDLNPEGYTYYMDQHGKIRSTSEGHPAANYLSMFGTFEEKTDDQGNKYVEMILDEKIEEIVKFYSAKSVADLNTMVQELMGMSDIDLGREFNLETDDDIAKMREKISMGAIPASSVIGSSAQDAYAQLGISSSPNADQEIKEGIVATFEALIHATLINSDFVNSERSRIEMEKEIEEINKNRDINAERKKVMKEEAEKRHLIGEKFYNFIQIDNEAFDKLSESYTSDVLSDITKAMNKLQYITEGDRRMPPSRKPISKVDKYMLHTKTEMPKERQEYIKVLQETPWYFNPEVAKYLNLTEAQKRNALREFGYVDLKKDGPFQQDEINKIIAVNDKIEREFDILIEYAKAFHNEDGTFDKFYLPWGETKSMRETVTSDLNPQESKLIRSLIYVDGHVKKLTSKNFKNLSSKNDTPFTGSEITDTEALEIAMAQGFDLDPDKLSGTGTFKAIREVIDIRGDDKDVFTFGDNDLGKAIEILVKDAYSDKKISKKRYADLMNTVFSEGEGHHAVQSVKMLQDLYRWKKDGMKGEFTSTLTLESDAITSGMMLTLLQLGSDNAQTLLAKGGIYTSEMKAQWEAYTKKWLAKKYDMDEDDIVFDPGALIEAGNYHASLYDEGIEKVDDINQIFMDLYKTIGMHAKEKVETTKGRIDERLSELDDQIDNDEVGQYEEDSIREEYQTLSAGKNLLSVIGNLSGGTLRKLAKSPVMVYIYGASVSSIKKKLTHSIGKEHLIKSIKSLYKKELLGEIDKNSNEFKYVESVIDLENLESYTYFRYNEDGKKERLTEKDLKKMDDFEKLMYIEFDTNIMDVLEKAVNLTFGDAFAQSFKDNFSEVDKARDIIKSIELLTFEVFKARLDNKVKTMMAENNGIMSKKNFNAILEEINKSGFGHNAPTGDAKSKNVQPLMKMDSSGSGKQASVVLSFDSNPGNDYLKNLQKRLSATLGTKVVIANTGAAPTITIHSLDGNIISKAIGDNPWLSIYDAIVQAADPKTMTSATKDYSYATIEESMNRNILKDNLAKLSFMMSELSDEKEIKAIKDRIARTTTINIEPEMKEEVIPAGSGFMYVTGGAGDKVQFGVRNMNVYKRTETVNVNGQKIEYIEYNGKKDFTGMVLRTVIKTYHDDGTVTISERHRRNNTLKKSEKGKAKEYVAYERVSTVGANEDLSLEAVMNAKDFSVVNLGNKSANIETVIGKQTSEMIPSKSGDDLHNDLRRLYLSMETILSNIESANGQLETRHNNEKQAYDVAHAWIFGGDFAKHDGRDKDEEFQSVDIESIVNFLKPVIEEGRENEKEFVSQEMNKIISKSKKKSMQKKDLNKIENAFEIAKSIGGSVEFIGNGASKSSTRAYMEKLFAPIGRANTGAYNDKSVVFVSVNGKGYQNNPTSGRVDPFNRYGELQGKYTNIDLAIEAGSVIVMDTPAHLKNMESNLNGLNTTSAEEIISLTGGDNGKYNYNVGEVQIANYLRTKGYERDENGVWTPKGKNLDYTLDQKIKEEPVEPETVESTKPKEDIIEPTKADKLRERADKTANELLEMMKNCKG